MRVLVLSNVYPPYYLGGYELRCQDIVNGLIERGHAVKVMTSTYGVEKPLIEEHVERVWHCEWNTHHKAHTRKQMLWAEVSDNLRLRWTLSRFKPDLISIWNMLNVSHSLVMTAQHSASPVVFHIEHDWMLRKDPWSTLWSKSYRLSSNVMKSIARPFINRLAPTELSLTSKANWVFVSDYRKKQHLGAGLPVADSPIIYGGIPHTRFQSRRFERFSPAARPQRLLFVGVLTPAKGPHVAIDALAHLHRRGYTNATLTVVGLPVVPDYFQTLRTSVASHGLESHVSFLGPKNRDEVPAVYREHDVLLFTSTRSEGFPLTILEAMASGLVVVSSAMGGQAEILKDSENALVYPTADAARLSECVTSLIDQPDFARRLAEAGHRLIHREFTMDVMLERYEKFLRQVIEGNRVVATAQAPEAPVGTQLSG